MAKYCGQIEICFYTFEGEEEFSLGNFQTMTMPSKDYQLVWIDEYLRHKTGQSPSQDEVLEVFNSVRKFMLCAHLQWSIWSVIQAENSSLDFDFVDYALQRFQQYKRWKNVVGI